MKLQTLVAIGVAMALMIAYSEALATTWPTCPSGYVLKVISGRCMCQCKQTSYCRSGYRWDYWDSCSCIPSYGGGGGWPIDPIDDPVGGGWPRGGPILKPVDDRAIP